MERGLVTQAVQRRLYCRTPLVESLLLHRSYVPEVPVFLKLENSQHTGSFKLRGLSRLCQHEASTVTPSTTPLSGLVTRR